MASKQATKAAAEQPEHTDFDPTYEWQDNATNYVLRVNLLGFKKEDFKVQVDAAGRLTVRGQRPAPGADCKYIRFHKVFQLPPTSNLDEISGRFEGSVLSLTVPKLPRAKTEEAKKVEEAKKAEAAKKVEEEEKAKKGEQEQEKPATAGKEEEKPKAEPRPSERKKEEEEVKPKEERRAEGERREEKAVGESLADMLMRRAEEEKARATAAAVRARVKAEEEKARAAVAARAKAAEERKAGSRRSCWKQQVVDELEGLSDLKWADGLMEVINKNKEVIATAVAAFSLGILVSQKLFSRK